MRRAWLVALLLALPAVASAQAAGESPSEMILGAPAPPPASTGVLPAGGPPWPGIGSANGAAPSSAGPSSAGPSSAGPSTAGPSSIPATPLSTPATPLTVPDVGATLTAPAHVTLPAPNATTP